MHPFLSLFSSMHTCLNVKASKVLIFFCNMNNLNQIINTDIYHHSNIMNTVYHNTILQLKTFKAQVTTNTRVLVYHRLYGSVAKRISHTAFNITCLS